MMASGHVITHLVGAKQLWNQTCAIYRGGGRGRERPAGMSGYPLRVGTSSRSSCRYGLYVRNVGRPISTVVPMSTLGSVSLDDFDEKSAQGCPDISYVDDLVCHLRQINSDSQLLWLGEFPPRRPNFRAEQWSLLQRYCSPKDTIVDIKVALENELVVMCVWYLFKGVPTTHTKEDVALALRNIFEAATDMHIDEESVTRYAPTKMSIDQDYVDALLVDLLCCKNEEVLRQVCYSLGFLHASWSHYIITLGNGIQEKLIQLSRDFSYDSPKLTNVLFAINRIAMVNKGMREKVIEAEFSDGFLRKLLTREGNRSSYLEAEAYFMICNFVCGQCNDETWKYLKKHLVRLVLDRCLQVCHVYVERAGALAIWMFVAKASSRCIKELFDTAGWSENLIRLVSHDDEYVKRCGFEAVETILSFGDDDPSNAYGKIIDELTNDWEIFLVSYPHSFDNDLVQKASGIVKRYRPDKHLEWLQEQDCLYTC